MSKRVTIMIEDDIDTSLRHIQANKIKKENVSVSFSAVLNQQLKKSL
ncbi:MAG: hypothetical protein J4F36_04900 [Nitrosopumilaceae archaeon]|nr:hypothetical protein [Nitrosopumilaceae archaeon]